MIKKWWKEATVYEIFPKSYKDTDGDGVGDLKGIMEKLKYIKELGINTIWLCPIFKSPMDDNGYDIADYYQVDSRFGSNEDLDELIQKAKENGIKVLLDLVINHTSDEHEWFQQALNDENSKYRDYYIFRKGIHNGTVFGPPNNWRSYFGESAWTRVGETDEFYLHAFSTKMPDLNWENEDMRNELYSMINWYLDKGLGGFRIDAILNIKKTFAYGTLPSDGDDGFVSISNYILNQPGVEVFLKELKERTFNNYDIMTVAEASVPDDQLLEFIDEDTGFFSMVFDFRHSDIDVPPIGEWFMPTNWKINDLRDAFYSSQTEVQKAGWGAIYLENHDQNRSPNKYFETDQIDDIVKKMLGTILMTLRGTPFIYQGEEIGMVNIPLTSIGQFEDLATQAQYERALAYGLTIQEAFVAVSHRSRDNSRTPMQWNSSPNAGFTMGKPWFYVNPNYTTINVSDEQKKDDSVLSFYKKLIVLRNNSIYKEALVYGIFETAYDTIDNLIAFTRTADLFRLLILVNFQNSQIRIALNETINSIVISNTDNVQIEEGIITLAPYQSIVMDIQI